MADDFTPFALYGHTLSATVQRTYNFIGGGIGVVPGILRSFVPPEEFNGTTAAIIAPLAGDVLYYNFRGNNDIPQYMLQIPREQGLFICGSTLVEQFMFNNLNGILTRIGVTLFTGSVGDQSFFQVLPNVVGTSA